MAVLVEPDQQIAKGAEVVRIESRQPGEPPPTVSVTAPLGGLVAKLEVKVGQPVSPDSTLMEIIDLSSVHALARVPEHLAFKLKPGLIAHIRVPGFPEEVFESKLEHVGAVPVVLQVNEVMEAVKSGKIEGIVTNWGNPLQGFNEHMKFHTDTQFSTSAFFILMHRARYDGLPGDVKSALDAVCCEAWVATFGPLWDKWDDPVREGAKGPGHEVVVPDAATMAKWREGLRPVSERYLDELAGKGFPNARAAYSKLVKLLAQ